MYVCWRHDVKTLSITGFFWGKSNGNRWFPNTKVQQWKTLIMCCLHSWISCTDKMTSLYWTRPLYIINGQCINEHDDVSNHQPYDCLHYRLFRCKSKKTPKLSVIGLCERNSPVIGEFPHKGPVTRQMFPFDDVIMVLSFLILGTITGISNTMAQFMGFVTPEFVGVMTGDSVRTAMQYIQCGAVITRSIQFSPSSSQ